MVQVLNSHTLAQNLYYKEIEGIAVDHQTDTGILNPKPYTLNPKP